METSWKRHNPTRDDYCDVLQRDLARLDLTDVCVYLGKSIFLEMSRAESESIQM